MITDQSYTTVKKFTGQKVFEGRVSRASQPTQSPMSQRNVKFENREREQERLQQLQFGQIQEEIAQISEEQEKTIKTERSYEYAQTAKTVKSEAPNEQTDVVDFNQIQGSSVLDYEPDQLNSEVLETYSDAQTQGDNRI